MCPPLLTEGLAKGAQERLENVENRGFYTQQVNQQRAHMALIPAYTPHPHRLSHERPDLDPAGWTEWCKEWGGFDPFSKTFYKLRGEEHMGMYYVLDAITAAVEAGYIDTDTWPEQLFESTQALQEFLYEFSSYDEEFRIEDRWWRALLALCPDAAEGDCRNAEEMASQLQSAAESLL